MGLGTPLKLVLQTFTVLSGPLISLIYPLYASIKAIERNSICDIQQWLMYWILFTLISLVELLIAKALKWIPFWPHAKVMVTWWLVLPFFSGAAYVYENFIRPYFVVNLQRIRVWFILQREEFSLRSENFLVVAERYIQDNGTEALEKLISKQGKSRVPNLARTDLGFPVLPRPKKAEEASSCSPCPVSTTSERNSQGHIDEKKQNGNEDKFWSNNLASKDKVGYGPLLQTPNRVDSRKYFNHLAGVIVSTTSERNSQGHIDEKKQYGIEDKFWSNNLASKDKVGYGPLLQTPNRVDSRKDFNHLAGVIVSTTSERNSQGHIDKKKQNGNDDKFWSNNLASKDKVGYGPLLQTPNRVDSRKDFNHLAGVIFRNLNYCLNPVARQIQWCTWEKPDIGWTKLNTDGSIVPQYASFGGLLRDCMGNPICAFVCKAPRDGIFSLELWAIWRGLILASGHGVKAIWVESDSIGVVNAINKDWPYPPKSDGCLKHIWKLLKKFEKHQVSHSWREANRAADHLAKMNLEGRDVVLWPEDFPKPLCNIIKEDAEGKKYRRR